ACPCRLVRWAVRALEEEGIYPEARHVRELLGQGTNGEIIQLIRENYHERSKFRVAAPLESAAYNEAFSVLCKLARRRVEAEFKDREQQLNEKDEAHALARGELEAAMRAAEDRQRSADELKAALVGELGENRGERTILQAQLSEANINLAMTTTALADVRGQLAEARDSEVDAQSRLLDLNAEINRIETELAIRDAAIERLERSSHEQTAEIETLRSKNAVVDGDVRAALKALEAARRRQSQSDNATVKMENALSKATTKLARERNQTSSYRDQLKVIQQQAAASQREVRHLTRTLAQSEKSRESDSDNLVLVRRQVDELRRELRKSQAKLLRSGRSSQQTQ
ncbi:MAG: hypothetical protein ACMG6H_04385, partial [Acidobacteriota bacterium]